jgi:hypothetical protein
METGVTDFNEMFVSMYQTNAITFLKTTLLILTMLRTSNLIYFVGCLSLHCSIGSELSVL